MKCFYVFLKLILLLCYSYFDKLFINLIEQEISYGEMYGPYSGMRITLFWFIFILIALEFVVELFKLYKKIRQKNQVKKL